MITCVDNVPGQFYKLSLDLYVFQVPFNNYGSEVIANLFCDLLGRMDRVTPWRRECETYREAVLAFFNLQLAVERECGSKVLGILEGSVLA